MPGSLSAKQKRKFDRKLAHKLATGRRLPAVWVRGQNISSGISRLSSSERKQLGSDIMSRWAKKPSGPKKKLFTPSAGAGAEHSPSPAVRRVLRQERLVRGKELHELLNSTGHLNFIFSFAEPMLERIPSTNPKRHLLQEAVSNCIRDMSDSNYRRLIELMLDVEGL